MTFVCCKPVMYILDYLHYVSILDSSLRRSTKSKGRSLHNQLKSSLPLVFNFVLYHDTAPYYNIKEQNNPFSFFRPILGSSAL